MIKPILFRFDAEKVHRWTFWLIRLFRRPGPLPLMLVSGVRSSQLAESKQVEVFGFPFHSRVGLAAGFDKNAEILSALPTLGFGFAEIGTVTPRSQPGNPMPRLFRDPGREAIFNRMGFNSLGAEVVSQRLRRIKPKLPSNFRVGVNLGKNKETPNEKAYADYVNAAKWFEGLADYLVINVSSPNTPGLRSLQTVEALKPMIESVGNLISTFGKSGKTPRPPLLLKLAPELQGEELAQLIQRTEQFGIDGWILTNTLGGVFKIKGSTEELTGGWSGKPLCALSEQSLTTARQATRKPILSVGGICSINDAVKRVQAGADLVQIYSGWIFNGPTFPGEVARILAQLRL